MGQRLGSGTPTIGALKNFQLFRVLLLQESIWNYSIALLTDCCWKSPNRLDEAEWPLRLSEPWSALAKLPTTLYELGLRSSVGAIIYYSKLPNAESQAVAEQIRGFSYRQIKDVESLNKLGEKLGTVCANRTLVWIPDVRSFHLYVLANSDQPQIFDERGTPSDAECTMHKVGRIEHRLHLIQTANGNLFLYHRDIMIEGGRAVAK
ncbi:hypothetical protein BOTBODRAFT_143478 [Botryobasidium botryosum FD-172 SS1]|uniref:Uncharacterized protein n=1 Tax=Botryobasidium botryosum (strain FD-172 SS1) TaxID=930990 RepID=A0A067N430_BOTB1|nr:hypothetical protein BOTBODRAFT_143478 [Botryobasidium botryosum FD-172 SS1]